MNAARPNIVFIPLDNVGWGDPGCYGGGKPERVFGAYDVKHQLGACPVYALADVLCRAVVGRDRGIGFEGLRGLELSGRQVDCDHAGRQ